MELLSLNKLYSLISSIVDSCDLFLNVYLKKTINYYGEAKKNLFSHKNMYILFVSMKIKAYINSKILMFTTYLLEATAIEHVIFRPVSYKLQMHYFVVEQSSL